MEKEPTNRELLESIEKLARSTAEGFTETGKNFERLWEMFASVQGQLSGMQSDLKGARVDILNLYKEKLHVNDD